MKRREFILGLGGAAVAWPLAARAQPEKRVPRIGLLSPSSAPAAAAWHKAFRQGLRDLGWFEGRNINIEYRYAEGKAELLPALAADLVRLNVDLIVASISTDALIAQKATKTIPIVMASAGDPVGSGLVESLAHPGGNITGLSQMAPDLAGKRLEVLKEIVPTLSRAAVLWNPQNPSSSSALNWKEMQLAAEPLGLTLHSVEVQRAEELDKALERALTARVSALAITPDPLFVTKWIAEFAVKNRLASIFHLREFVEAGGLVSYGIDRSDQFRRASAYVDKILKGARPADLPVEQPTKFELAINLKTAKALGFEIPPQLVALADEVIE
jgi:putative ABC transport system substrate-binding protein